MGGIFIRNQSGKEITYCRNIYLEPFDDRKNTYAIIEKKGERNNMIMLYKKGWSPEEITLAFTGINKNRKQVEKFVMRAIKPLFN